MILPGRANSHQCGNRASAGYFLQEVVVSLFILGIIAAIAIPKYTASLDYYRFQVARQRLVQDIELARRHARLTSQKVTLFVSFNKNFYSISPLDSPLRPSSTHQVDLSEAFLCPIIGGLLSPNSRSIQSDLIIAFDRYGAPDKETSIGICCGNKSGGLRISAEGHISLQ